MRTNTKEFATKNAKALAKTMGSNWEPQVWENIGWWYCVRFGDAEIIPNEKMTLNEREIVNHTCYITSVAGQAVWHDLDPKKAFEGAFDILKVKFELLAGELEALKVTV